MANEHVEINEIQDPAKRTSKLRRGIALAAVWLLTVVGLAAFLFSLPLLFFVSRSFVLLARGESSRPGWFGPLETLDVSSCSAWILFLVGWNLFLGGLRSGFLVPWSEGSSRFWRHAYGYRLFPSWLSLFTLRLGLLGTLFAFVLASLIHLDVPANSEANPAAVQGVEADKVRDDQVGAEWGAWAQRVFQVLCAALFSTLAGCLAAYVVIPVLEWVNSEALAHAQLRSRSNQSAASQAADLANQKVLQANESLLEAMTKLKCQFDLATSGVGEAAGRLRKSLESSVEQIGRINQVLAMGREFVESCQAMPKVAGQLQALAEELAAARGGAASAVAALEKSSAVFQAVAVKFGEASDRREVQVQMQHAQADLVRAVETVGRLRQGVALVGAEQEWSDQADQARAQVAQLLEEVADLKKVLLGSRSHSSWRLPAWLSGSGKNGEGGK